MIRKAIFREAKASVSACFQPERFSLAKVALLQGFFGNCGPSLDVEQGEVIDHAEKLSPQEQCATAFGFVTLNPPFWRSSL